MFYFVKCPTKLSNNFTTKTYICLKFFGQSNIHVHKHELISLLLSWDFSYRLSEAINILCHFYKVILKNLFTQPLSREFSAEPFPEHCSKYWVSISVSYFNYTLHITSWCYHPPSISTLMLFLCRRRNKLEILDIYMSILIN